MTSSQAPNPHFPRRDNACVVTYFSYRCNGYNDVRALTYAAEDDDYFYESAFDVLKPGDVRQPDFLLEELSNTFIDPNGRMDMHERRLFLVDMQAEEGVVLHDDHGLKTMELFLDNCDKIEEGLRLKSIAMKKTPKNPAHASLGEKGKTPIPE